MDIRKWILEQDLPRSASLLKHVEHVPCTDYRSDNVMGLYLSGFRTGFRLTDHRGRPTESLRLLAAMLRAQLCQYRDLPEEERRALHRTRSARFLLGEILLRTWDEVPERIRAKICHADSWFLRGITQRLRAASVAPWWIREWAFLMFPCLARLVVRYKTEDGKRRTRVTYLAYCVPEWRMDDYTYEGLFRWNNDHAIKKWPDPYGIVRSAGGWAQDSGNPCRGGGAAFQTGAVAEEAVPDAGCGAA